MSKRGEEAEQATASSKRFKKLVLPQRQKKSEPPLKDLTKGLDSVVVNTEILPRADAFKCLLCGEQFLPPFPPRIQKIVNKLKKNERDYIKELEDERQKQVQECSKKGRPPPPPMLIYNKVDVSLNDKKFICRMHKVEYELKPLAEKKGWPRRIDFDKIGERMSGEFMEEMKQIIDGALKSSFRDEVVQLYQELGPVKSRNPLLKIERFQKSLPGYYGNQGADIIMDVLSQQLLKPGYLTDRKAEPLKAIEYMQEILVPEIGIRLIKQDELATTLEQAKQVMKESTEYGSIVYKNAAKIVKDE